MNIKYNQKTINILKLFIILALLTAISGCRELSDMLDPDKNASKKELKVVKRENPNLSFENAKLDVDPDSDDLTEDTKPESVGNNSNVALEKNDNSSDTKETDTDEDNPNTGQESDVSADNNTVTFNSFGKVRVGMTVSKASQSLGTELVGEDEDGMNCYYVNPQQGFKGVRFMVTDEKIARIDIESNQYQTDKGAKIGDTEDKIKSLYSGVQVNPQKYDENKNDLEVYFDDEQYLIIFETDGNRVTGFRVGKAEEVGYVEGCS